MMGTIPQMFWVQVSQCLSTVLFAYMYTRQNTLSLNKMSVLVKLRAINEIFNK